MWVYLAGVVRVEELEVPRDFVGPREVGGHHSDVDLDGGLVGKGVKVGAKVVGSMEGERSMWYLPAGHSRHEAASGKL